VQGRSATPAIRDWSQRLRTESLRVLAHRGQRDKGPGGTAAAQQRDPGVPEAAQVLDREPEPGGVVRAHDVDVVGGDRS
jgi:hypothetical protein